MDVENLVGLRYHGGFYTGIIRQGQQNGVSKGILYRCIPRIGRLITILDEVFLKVRVTFYDLVIRKNKF